MSYDDIYYKQIKDRVSSSDIIIVLSASGNSKNLVKAVKYAKEKKMTIISIVGNFDGNVLKFSDYKIVIDSKNYGIIEDIHLSLNHVISNSIKEKYHNV